MKKLILSLTLLLTFGFNTEVRAEEVKKSNEIYFYEDVKVVTDLLVIKKDIDLEIAVKPDCIGLGGEIFAAALESGMSYEDSWNLGVAMVNVCNALVLLSNALN